MVRRSLAGSLVVLALGGPAGAACALAAGETGRVERVVDGETLELDTGLAVRLIGALAPQRPATVGPGMPWPPGDRARAALAEAALGRTVRLFYGRRRRDRHDRALAQVFATGDGSRAWLQGMLVSQGLALAYSFADAQGCLDDLLSRESAARAGKRGLWADGGFAVVDALDVETLVFAEHRFVVVEGRVHDVGEGRGRLYVNFEADWRRDFTLAIAARDRQAFERAGIDFSALAGRRIRARGWIVRRNGPMIEADHAAQVELLD